MDFLWGSLIIMSILYVY